MAQEKNGKIAGTYWRGQSVFPFPALLGGNIIVPMLDAYDIK